MKILKLNFLLLIVIGNGCSSGSDPARGNSDTLEELDCGIDSDSMCRQNGWGGCGPEGICVECTDDEQCADPMKPFCDQATNTCHSECQSHDQCSSGVCGDDGVCADPANLIYLSPTAAQASDSGDCTLATPCKTFNKAQSLTTANRYVVVLQGVLDVSTESISISQKKISIIGDERVAPAVIQSSHDDTAYFMKIADFANVEFANLTVKGGLVECENSDVKMLDTKVDASIFTATKCDVLLDGSDVSIAKQLKLHGETYASRSKIVASYFELGETGTISHLTDVQLISHFRNTGPVVMSKVLSSGETFEAWSDLTVEDSEFHNAIQDPANYPKKVIVKNTKLIGNDKSFAVGINTQHPTVLELDHVHISNFDRGIHVFGASVKMENSVVEFNNESGIHLLSTEFEIRNNVIARNGNQDFGEGGVVLRSEVGIFEHNTVVDNQAATYRTGGIMCEGEQQILRNNIFWGNRGETEIENVDSGCVISYSAVEFAADISGTRDGGHNVVLADPKFIAHDIASGSYDLHLQADSLCRDSALPGSTTEDIDGEVRDSSPDMGADEVKR